MRTTATIKTGIAFVLVIAAQVGQPLAAQDAHDPSPDNLAARASFQDAKFGLFVHWGIYSVLGAGEWVMQVRGIPADVYEGVAAQFNPVRFDAAAWVSLVKDAGMSYITITAKHHDGFAMFDSAVTDWDIVDRTQYGRDVLAELAEECSRQGIKLFFYYSQLDWHHPDYFPRGQTGQRTGRPDDGDWQNYLHFMDAQLAELLTNYGEVGGIWFDGMWDRPDAEWALEHTYGMIHGLQPATLVGSNHHRDPFPGEDFQMFEKDLPGRNTAGFNEAAVSELPLETAETINRSWGFNLTDADYKSAAELIRYLVRAAGADANFLLNVGPMPDGRIQPEFQERLRSVGDWMRTYGRSIRGTRGGPIFGPWGVSTTGNGKVFVHVLEWNGRALAIPSPGIVEEAQLLRDGSAVTVQEVEGGIVLTLPERPEGLVDEVVQLTLAR